jgi:glutaredoxin
LLSGKMSSNESGSEKQPSALKVTMDSIISDIMSYLNEYVHYCGGNLYGSVVGGDTFNNVMRMVDDHDVVVFGKHGCGFCKRAKDLLAKQQEIKPFDILVTNVNKNTIEGKDMAKCLREVLNLGDLTFPQIIVRGKYIGGADDLSEHVEENRFFAKFFAGEKIQYHDANGDYDKTKKHVVWEENTLASASKPQLLQVPVMRGEGVWYPHWPWYCFQWTLWSNLVRFISWIQLAIMIPAFYLYKQGSDQSVAVANILMLILVADCCGLVLFGPSPWTISGTLSTYFGWRVRGNAVSSIPYKFVFGAYILTLIPLYTLKKQEALETALAGFIVNSALLAVLRF